MTSPIQPNTHLLNPHPLSWERWRTFTLEGLLVGDGDRFWLFIFTLNRAKKWFKSIFNSKLNQVYSFNRIIHSNWKKIKAWQNSEKLWKKHAKWGVFYSKRTFYSFFLWISHFFDSFKNSFNSTAKIFIQRIYSFKKISDYSFNKNIHFLKKCRIGDP